MSKKLINGLKYEKLTEEQLGDLSQWELVDIILAYREELKAKEQECEELKKRLIKCDDNIIVECEYLKNDLCSFIHRKKEVINGLQEQLDQLKAENDELKKQHQGDKGLITSTGKMNYQLIQEYDKLKTALTEIKEIAEEKANVNDWLALEILQKISEVEE